MSEPFFEHPILNSRYEFTDVWKMQTDFEALVEAKFVEMVKDQLGESHEYV